MYKLYNSAEVGSYLSRLVQTKFKNERTFCKECVILQNIEPTDEEIHKMQDRFSHIKKGTRNIQIEDLPIFTELLGVSCEEIITAGRQFVPSSTHITNYEIAYSKDRAAWHTYVEKHQDLFLNYDEYNKSIFDYLFEFKNYDFLKYLVETKYVWFVNNSDWQDRGYSFGAGTSISKHDPLMRDCSVPYKIQTEDKMRTQMVALALENHDYEILDMLHAREIPSMYRAHNIMSSGLDVQKFRNEDLINTVSESDEYILDYFSQTFEVESRPNEFHTFIFADLHLVIDKMIESGRKEVELLIRRVCKHNKDTYDSLTKMINDAIQYQIASDKYGPDTMIPYYKKNAYEWLIFDSSTNIVSYYFCRERHDTFGMITNIFPISAKSTSPLINELIEKSNIWFKKITELKDKN